MTNQLINEITGCVVVQWWWAVLEDEASSSARGYSPGHGLRSGRASTTGVMVPLCHKQCPALTRTVPTTYVHVGGLPSMNADDVYTRPAFKNSRRNYFVVPQVKIVLEGRNMIAPIPPALSLLPHLPPVCLYGTHSHSVLSVLLTVKDISPCLQEPRAYA